MYNTILRGGDFLSSQNFGEYFINNPESPECLLEALEPIENIIEMLEDAITDLAESLYNIFKTIFIDINSFGISEIYIPNINIFGFDCYPNAPPQKAQSIFNEAIENMKYNLHRYKNSFLIKVIRKKSPAFIENLIFSVLVYWIFKALGMQ